jgi:hypothetical protein
VRPKDHIGIPARYSPLQANGNGIQTVYLTEIPEDFAEVLAGLIGEEARLLMGASRQKQFTRAVTKMQPATISTSGEHRLEQQVEKDDSIRGHRPRSHLPSTARPRHVQGAAHADREGVPDHRRHEPCSPAG